MLEQNERHFLQLSWDRMGRTNAKEGWGERQALGSIKLKMHHKDESTIKKIIRGITGFRGNQEA